MSYTIRYEPEAREDLINFTSQVQMRIVKKLDWLAENIDSINPLGLTGNLVGFYKLRVGDYRVLYELDENEELITIVRIGHRSEIYDDL